MTTGSTDPEGGQLSAAPPDDIAGDMGDQAARLQAMAEQEAIAAALDGRVHGSNALDDRAPYVEPLEAGDPLAEPEASDDPVHGGGRDAAAGRAGDDLDVMALATAELDREEGSSVDDDAPLRFEDDGDPDFAEADLEVLEDDDLDLVPTDTVDPDDPDDPDGYGVPPGAA